jgi:hypothetical protein
MNLFDIYVQYSICEGFGMPVLESMACGIPAMVVNYSAMEDHAKMPGGIPIRVQRFFYEAVIETEQRRALPDNDDFGRKLTWFMRLSQQDRDRLAKSTRDYMVEATEVYGQEEKLPRSSWDRTAAIWTNLLRTMPIHDVSQTWEYPEPRILSPNMNPPKPDMTHVEFVHWLLRDVLRSPELVRGWTAREWTKWLNTGFRMEPQGKVDVNRQFMMRMVVDEIRDRNDWERRRVASLVSNNPDRFVFRVV